MISKNLEATLQKAIALAKKYRHEYTTVEHLLMALTEDSETLPLFKKAHVKIEPLCKQLLAHLKIQEIEIPDNLQSESRVTIGFQRVLQRASLQAQSLHMTEIIGAHLLASIFAEEDSYAAYLLEKNKLNRSTTIKFLEEISLKRPKKKRIEERVETTKDTDNCPEQQQKETPEINFKDKTPDGGVLEKYCANLNQKAIENSADPILGRAPELERIFHILCRRTKNNPLLVGDPGVGKTALIEGLAQKIVQKKAPSALQDAEIYALDMGGLVAGTRFRGDFEERFKSIIQSLEEKPKAILFIDEAHTMIGTGSVQGGAVDVAGLIKPALAKGKIRCIATTTFKDYRNHLEKDLALLRRFQKVEVKEPSPEDTVCILEGIVSNLEQFHNVLYKEGSIQAAVDLSMRYVMDRRLPDKAIDILDEVGAKKRLSATSEKTIAVTTKDVENTVAQMASVPSKQVSKDDKFILKNLEKSLKAAVFGQDQAVHALVHSIKLSRSGLRSVEKPIGCYLFSGPTGVGKTEISRQLSYSMGMPLIRFDMSEYMEKHSVAKLIGAPPGYVGYEQGGLLTDAINKTPYAVVLLDEIEKAHPDIFNILLQLMDYGIITDHHGASVNCRNIILIMTTNAGAAEMSKHGLGFGNEKREGDDEDAIHRLFSPEFRNRLDAIIPFKHLDEKVMLKIVSKFLLELEHQLEDKHISFEVDDAVKRWLTIKGFDRLYGARPLSRIMDEHIKKALADEILFGKLENGGTLSLSLKNNTIQFQIKERVLHK